MTILNGNNKSLPLVSIVIPTYNQTKYLKIALESAIKQTYENTEIIICDDSTTEDVKLLILEYATKNNKIKYINNGGPLGGHGNNNIEKCFQEANGEYISFLLHDDEYYPTKIEKMVNKFLEDDSVVLVTSSRVVINDDGDIIENGLKPYTQDIKVSGEEVARRLLFNIYNIIGEFTTVLFRKSAVIDEKMGFNNYLFSNIRCLTDISLFLKLCAKGKMFFLEESLSKFRLHSEQNTEDKSILNFCAIDFFNMIIDSYEVGLFIKNENELKYLLDNWRRVYSGIMNHAIMLCKSYNEEEQDFNKFKARLMKYNINLESI